MRVDDKSTKDYKDNIHKDVSAKTDSTTQHLGQDNLCYRSPECRQANEGQQVEGKDNTTSGFNDQGKNIQQQQQPAGASSQTGTLLVTKNVSCAEGFTCPQPSAFTMHVTGASGNGNPSPSSFAGSTGGTNVKVNLGTYNVTETIPANAPVQLKLVKHFGADCSGSIETAGESKESNVLNEFIQKTYVFLNKWGSSGTGNGQFNLPAGVAVDPSTGNVFVADFNNDRIQVFFLDP